MSVRFASLGIVIAFALLGAGCDDSDHDLSVPYAHKTDYQVASCQFAFTDGGQAEKAGTSDYRKFLFDKELDYSKIRAISKASAAATLEFVQNEGVSVFAAHDAEEGNCAMFNSLAEAPTDLREKFKSTDSSEKKHSFLVGLFIPKSTEEVPSSSSYPEIGMRRDANRWTLVHEFSHFLFDSDVRRSGGAHTDEVKKRFSENFEGYKVAARAYIRNQTQQNFDAATGKMQAAYAGMREVILRYWAEEMTIETMLRNAYFTNELRYVPFGKRSSYWYIYSSGDKALTELDKFSDEIDHLITEAGDKSFWTDFDKLADVRSDLNAFRNKIASTASDARTEFESAAAVFDATQEAHVPCAHMREAQELTEKLKFDTGWGRD